MAGNSKGHKRRFGNVRQLPSGQYQARYKGPDGLPRKAPRTFDTKRAAEQWLVQTEAEMIRGDWLDPEAAKVPLAEYAADWMRERDLKARTREEYARLLRLHVVPTLGTVALSEITAPRVLADGVGPSTVAKTYRILHAILNTAVDDDLIRRNPCRIKRAGQDTAAERPTATLDQVFAIAAAISPRYRLMVLLATFAQLRFGELVALRRNSINLATMELRVRRATAEMDDGSQHDDDPKSAAGKRVVGLPAGLRPDIEHHLTHYASPAPPAGCSSARPAASRAAATSTAPGNEHSGRPAYRPISAYTCTTYATPAALGQRRAAPRSRKSWPGSASPAPAPP